ncbi:MAG: hypothetical protein JXR58_06610 [Bacteroidales bacterium]|nr:hypothetical protein [Bacteroidales bacterium]
MKKSKEYYFAKAISWIFHPMLAPTIGIYIINTYFGDRLHLTEDGELYLIIITAISTILLPSAFIPMMLHQKIITSIEIKTSKERLSPLFLFAIFYFFAWYVLFRLQAPLVYKTFMFTAGTSVLIGLGINFLTKVSMHMIGIGGLTGSVYSLMLYSNANLQLVIVILILIAGFTAYSRLKLNAHSPLQVYLGYVVGVFVAICLFYFFKDSLYL